MKNPIVLIGAGSANMFGALKLLRSGVAGHQIIIIEQGGTPFSRTREGKDIVHGFAGAGLWSDGKLVFSKHPDQSILRAEDKERLFPEILEMIDSFEPTYQTVTHPSDKDLPFSLDLLQSSVYHLGTDGNVEFGKRVFKYLINNGVIILFKLKVSNIQEYYGGCLSVECEDVGAISPVDMMAEMVNNRFGAKVCDYSRRERKLFIKASHIQVGLGKTGVKQFREWAKNLNVPISSGCANIGFRFEMPMNDEIRSIIDLYQYDFKFSKAYRPTPDLEIDIRTFCVNNYSAYVVEEVTTIDGISYMTYNGHGYGKDHPKVNDMTNFGVIARIKCKNKEFDANVLHELYIRRGFGEAGFIYDGVGLQDMINNLSDRLMDESIFGDLYRSIFQYWTICLSSFMEELQSILNITEFKAYAPEIKMAGGVVATSENFTDVNGIQPNISWVGDCHTGVVGIIPSAVTGVMGAEGILNKLSTL